MGNKMSTNVFLVQATGKKSEHDSEAETWAEEPIKYKFYRNNGWHKGKKDEDFGKVTEGDIVLLYCTGNVEECPKQVKYIFEVENIVEEREEETETPNQLNLRVKEKLDRGFELAQIRKWVDEGKLSESMNKAGTQGFNITQVEKNDYKAIKEWVEERGPEPPTIEPYEEDLRAHLVRVGPKVIGPEYENYELYEDEEGNTGELYNTSTVGEIDLLYEDEENGSYLVIELKRSKDTPDKVIGQLARYLGWVREEIAENPENVKGMVISQSPSTRLRYAVKAMNNCELAEFELSFKIKKIS